MWIIINVILIIVGVFLIGYAFYIDSTGGDKVWFYFFGGGVVFVFGVISSLIKWWFT